MNRILTILLLFACMNVTSQSSDIRKSGDYLHAALPMAAALSTFIWNDDTKPTWQYAKAYALSYLTTQAVKRIINKRRPDGGDRAFPSGHTSAAFSGASFLERRFGWKVGIPAYIIASYTGWTRIHAKKHDGWDVFAGAIVGIGSSYLFAKPYQEQKAQLSFQKLQTGEYVVGLRYTF